MIQTPPQNHKIFEYHKTFKQYEIWNKIHIYITSIATMKQLNTNHWLQQMESTLHKNILNYSQWETDTENGIKMYLVQIKSRITVK